MKFKTSVLVMLPIIAAFLIGFPLTASAKDPVNTNFWGVAIKSYDPFAYFTAGKPVKREIRV